MTFFQRGKPIVLVQKWPFYQLSFLGNIGHENVFHDIREEKNAFLGYKKRKFKQSKINIFPKGLTHGVGSKNGHFSNFFFLGNIGQENVFYDILERKNAFLGYKNKKLKKCNNWHFPKGVNPWWRAKNRQFSNFFLRQYLPGKCILWYSQNEKTPF